MDVSWLMDTVTECLDIIFYVDHFKAMLRYYRESRAQFPTNNVRALDSLLDKIHERFGCGVAYDFVHNYAKDEISLEALITIYVITCTHAFGRETNNRYSQNILATADGLMNSVRSLYMWWRLCDYQLRNQVTWLTGPNVVTLTDLVRQSFTQQIRDSRLVTNIILKMYDELGGMQIAGLWTSPHDVADIGIRLLRKHLGKPCYGVYSYYVRSLNDMKADVGDHRLNLYLPNFIQEDVGSFRLVSDTDIFYYGVRYPIRYYNDIDTRPFRHIVIFAIRFLPVYIHSLGNYEEIFMILVRQEVRGLLLRQDQYTEAEKFLIHWDLMFRTITDPLVSLKEIREYCIFAGITEEAIEAICFSYSTLFPRITAQVFAPRSLRHLSRCCVRRAMYDAYQQPEAVFQLDCPDSAKYYLNLEDREENGNIPENVQQ